MSGSRLKAVAALVLVALMLAACGKKGPPDPPGPSNEVIWPRTYPTH
jgi:predicted small lipoprotein YifL